MKRFIGIVCIVLLAAAFQSFGTNVKKDIRPPGCMELNAIQCDLQLQTVSLQVVSMNLTPVYTLTAYALMADVSPGRVSEKDQNISNAGLQIQLPDKTVLNSKVTGLPMVRAVLISNRADFSTKILPDIRRLTCNDLTQLNKPDKTLLHSCPTIRYL